MMDVIFEMKQDELPKNIMNISFIPNIPVQTTFKLGEMSAKLLEKVEELTLNLIEQNNKTNQLEKEMKVLKRSNNQLQQEINTIRNER